MTRISTRIFVTHFHSIHFEGVDSCFYVWVNGAYAGYSQVPHATSEFDVTDLLNEGEIH